MPDTILWVGPRTPWADALGAPAPATAEVSHVTAADAALVVLADGPEGHEAWLRQPRTRPAVLVVSAEAGEEAALTLGAEGVVAPAATEAEAQRAARQARARHAAVQRDAELYRLMVESVPDLVTVSDATGRSLYASPGAQAQSGYSPDELVGQTPFETIHPDDRDRVAEAFEAGLVSGQPVTLVYRSVGPDGETRSMESVGRGVLGPDGAPYAVVITRDVTRRVQTERQLQASEARYRAVVTALPDVVSRIRTDGLVLDFHVPEAFATEFPAAHLVGRRLQDVIPDDLADKFEDALARLAGSGETAAYDYHVRVGERTRHREVRIAPLGPDEVISMLRDVTALREHEAALEHSRAELRALAAHLQEVREDERTRLSREVHDVLGQQLTAIRLGIGWFGRHYAGDEAAQTRLADVREIIDETIQHVRQIAADLRPGVLDDFGLASAVQWQAVRFEERSGLVCRVDVQGDAEPPRDRATAAFRVLQEALTNVARHAQATAVSITLVLRPDAVRLVVADDGRGFDARRTRRRSLGLVGMRERAGALGGTLEVTGLPGQGTVVECTLPVSPDPPPQ